MIRNILQLPELKLTFHVKHSALKEMEQQELFHVKHEEKLQQENAWNLLLAGGRAPNVQWLEKCAKLSEASGVYCADRGGTYAMAAGLSPTLLVGDCDSTSKAVYAQAEKLGAKNDIHPPAKDDTDLQLLLSQLPGENLCASGIWGGRFDHLFSNVYSLLEYKRKWQNNVVLADHEELMILLRESEAVSLDLKSLTSVQALSLLPLTSSTCVSIEGVQWPLRQAELKQQHPYAVSNVPVSKNIPCSCISGALGLYIHWQK